jgi:GT2 family glycosyltransferase
LALLRFLAAAARKALGAFREGRLSPSPFEWGRLLRQLAREREQETAGFDVQHKPAKATPRADASEASTIPAADADAYRLALVAFLSGHQRLDFTHARPRVSVVVALHNRAELTLRCLRALAASSIPLQLVVVDNGSTDRTAPLLERLNGAIVIRNEQNLGFLKATNQGAKAATADLLLLLNNDTDVPAESLEAAIETLESSERIGAVVAKLVHLDGRLQEAGAIIWRDGTCQGYGRGDRPTAPPYLFRRDVDYGSGAFLLTRRRTWETLGGFDERFAPAYYEDADFCARIWQSGLRVVYEPRAVVKHAEFGSGSPATSLALQTERRSVFFKKHRPWIEATSLPRGTSTFTARHATRDGQRILFIEDRIPHGRLGSGYPRSLAIVNAALALGHHITVFPLLVPDEPWEDAYADVPREAELWLGGGAAGLRTLMQIHGADYDSVIVSRPHNMRVARHALPSERRPAVIYDAEAIFALREVGRRRLRGRQVTPEAAHQLVGEEVALAKRSDLVLTVSEDERQHFYAHGIKRVMVLGHSLAPQPTPAPFAEREALLFVGAFVDQHSPNTDSVQWLMRDVLPLVEPAIGPHGRLVVAGRDADRLLKRSPAVDLVGAIEDLRPLFDRARVFVAPIRFGAGLPAKAYQAAAYGVPIVASTLVAAQLGWQDEVDLLVADDAARFAEQCVRLYRDEALWTRLREAALARASQECAPDAFRLSLSRALTIAQRVRSGDVTTGVGPQSES